MINKSDLSNLKAFLESNSPKAKISKVVLIAIVLGALPFITLGAAAMGNAVQVFKGKSKNKRYSKRQVEKTISYLKKRKMVEFISEKNGVTTLCITKKGESQLKSFSIDSIAIAKPVKWDSKWRVVMFDLPVRYKQARNALRYKLRQIGFMQLQKSVWIYPYPCIDEILYVADYYKVSNYIDILTVENILNDKRVKNHFNLI